MDVAGMPLKSVTRDGLKLTDAMFDKVKSTFKRAIYDFAQDLENKGAGWYSDTWIENNLNKLADHLHESLERWRTLYASAKSSLSKATGRIDSGVLAANSEEYTKLVKLQNQSTRQLNLLVNDTGNRFSELSEFYPYRYLASEGYLPGYNFTRLPVRVFLQAGGRGGKDGE
jgi:hypothetical protein